MVIDICPLFGLCIFIKIVFVYNGFSAILTLSRFDVRKTSTMADNNASDGVDIDHLITHLLFSGPTRSSQQQNPLTSTYWLNTISNVFSLLRY